ncbi:PREDICTED: venom protein 302-like [Branchiostoma belcheri]|uniref:Venom protein 302-like n=1 Tax=Branchiostoma belcheri TaxID=7741 RepID=A0A6P4YMA0_BRABE|nr:PREDICTED: venom protein 302-like [Branchiostoma belcheri]
MGKILIICLVLLAMVNGLAALSCLPCGEFECQEPPKCKRNANYVKDVCGCCDVCAKVKGESCGGLWNLDGTCADGLICQEPDPPTPNEDGLIAFNPHEPGTCVKDKKAKKEKKGRKRHYRRDIFGDSEK